MKHPQRLAAAFLGFLICVGADAHSARAREASLADTCALAAPIAPPRAPGVDNRQRAKFVGGARVSALVATACPRASRAFGA